MQNKARIPVVFATDDKFAPFCALAIASLIDHASGNNIYDIIIFYDDLADRHKRLICSMSTENVTIRMMCVSDKIDKNLLYVYDWISVATYYRFFVGELLPEYDKVLYLDSDIVVLRDVAELYQYNLDGFLLGGVVVYRDSDYERNMKITYLSSLGLTPERYINAGITLVNTKAYREEGTLEKYLDYLATHRNLQWMDQDVLNVVGKDRIKFLPMEWNMNQMFYDDDYKAGKDLSNVGIIHYMTGDKPGFSSMRLSHVFAYEYAVKTPYRKELTDMFLKCNQKLISNIRREVYEMAERGDVGPRFFASCVKEWAKGKIKRAKQHKKTEK